jgi:hypothetical protein
MATEYASSPVAHPAHQMILPGLLEQPGENHLLERLEENRGPEKARLPDEEFRHQVAALRRPLLPFGEELHVPRRVGDPEGRHPAPDDGGQVRKLGVAENDTAGGFDQVPQGGEQFGGDGGPRAHRRHHTSFAGLDTTRFRPPCLAE